VTRKLFVVVAVLALTSLSLLAQSKPSIQGVWRIAEVTTTGPNAYTNKSPQPGLYIFTAKHYSLVRDTAREVRPAIKDITNPTAAEALATFNPFQGQAGTYEVSGTTLKVTPAVAKVPPASGKYGTTASYSLKMQGETLWLTQVLGNRGTPVANPGTIRLTRVE
jgi:hypothetical protein